MLTILLTLLHIVVSLALILVVLLQTGKRADLAGAFGGGGSQTAFGTRGAATFLSKATTAAAVLFMVTSLSLSILSSRTGDGGSGTVLNTVPAEESGEPDAEAPLLPPLPADDPDADPAEDPGLEPLEQTPPATDSDEPAGESDAESSPE